MRLKIISIAIVIAFTYTGCENNKNESDHHDHAKTNEHEHNIAMDDHQNSVNLNNGEKWEANKETTDGINNMIVLVKNLPAEAAAEECKQMKEKLNTEYAMIIEKCTMEGESHNQLHNYLVPLSGYINELDKGDIENCTKNINLINNYLAEYSLYFH